MMSSFLLALAIAGWGRVDEGLLPTTILRDGDRVHASLQRIEPGWQLVVRRDQQPRHVAAAELVQWGAFRDSDRGPQIVMADGSWLIGELLQIDDGQLRFDSALWGAFSVPRESVRGVLFNPSVDPAKRDQLRQQILDADGSEDLLWLENGDLVTGTAQEVIEEESRPGDVSVALQFISRGRQVRLPLNKIAALVMNPSRKTRVSHRAVHVVLGLADGSRLIARDIELPGNRAKITLLGGLPLTIDQPSLWDLTVALQPINAGMVYLSDLESASYRHIPLLSQTVPLARDRSARGGPLRVGRDLYVKGLGMPSASRVAYVLRGQYQRFEADVALDDSAGPSGSVVFRVFLGDGQGRWQAAWESPLVRSGDAPRSVSVDTSNSQAMALIVDLGERGDVQDHAVWLNARLIAQESP